MKKLPWANILTGFRAFLGILMMLLPDPLLTGILFYTAGVTDIFDGMIARRTGTVSRFGAVFDTAADFIVFVGLAGYLIASYPRPILYWIAGIAVAKIATFAYGMIVYGRPVAVHSTFNRVTGICVYVCLPLASFGPPVTVVSAVTVCSVATAAVVAEFVSVRRGRFES